MMNIQRHIRRILREENTLPNLIRRRFSEEELDKLVSNVKRTFETHRISQQHREDVIDAEVDDFIMNSVYYSEFEDFDDEIYQDIYNQYREPLVDYIKSKIDMNLQESIRRILREESNYTNTNVNIGDIYEESDIYQYIQKLHYKRDYDFWEGNLGERIEKFPYYDVKEIPIKDIEMDEYQLDEDDIEEYIEMFKKRGSYPPIVLGKKSYGYYNIIDGTHRANALRELGFDKIICFVGKKKI